MNYDNETTLRMNKVIDSLESKYVNVRAGRANPGMLAGIDVEYYGARTPLTSIANIVIPEARQLFIKPFDRSALKDIERAINEANIGITPTNNGETIILTIPELSEERRKDYVKQIKSLAEDAKVALRNIRQDMNNSIKKEELSEDEKDSLLELVQDLTNKYNKKIEDLTKNKETELMSL